MLVPRPLHVPPGNPVSRQRRGAEDDNGAEHQLDGIIPVHPVGNGPENQAVIQQRQHIQALNRVHDPLFVYHEQRQNQDAGHSREVKKAEIMDAEEKEFNQHQPGAQVFIKRARPELGNVQEPHAEAARRQQRKHPEFPRQNQNDQAQYSAEYRGGDGQQQVTARLFLRPHAFSNSWLIRLRSSSGR